MHIFQKYQLLIRLILGILMGILIGTLNLEWLVRLMSTFTGLFGSFLSFIVPLIILTFITKGIADLGQQSKKLLGIVVAMSYGSTVLVGLFVFLINSNLFPVLLQGTSIPPITEDSSIAPYITLDLPPLMSVLSALVLSFILGIGLSSLKNSHLKSVIDEFHGMVVGVISKIVIPLLPVYIAGVFAGITYTGHAAGILLTFAKVFGVVISLQISVLVILYVIAGIISKKNPFVLIKNMLPAYFTAIGTQSSAATIPVTALSIKSNGVKPYVAEFVASLCANIHMSGSMTTITSCAIAVMIISGFTLAPLNIIGFIFMLGIMTVAAPGLPGGAIIASLGLLQSNLGFTEAMTALMVTLYLAQDSFGTAGNVTGDGAIAVIVDKIAE